MNAAPTVDRNKKHEHLIDQIKLRDDQIRALKAELAATQTVLADVCELTPRLPLELQLRLRALDRGSLLRRSRPRG